MDIIGPALSTALEGFLLIVDPLITNPDRSSGTIKLDHDLADAVVLEILRKKPASIYQTDWWLPASQQTFRYGSKVWIVGPEQNSCDDVGIYYYAH